MVISVILAILTILGPVLTPLLVRGIEWWLARGRQDPIHGAIDEADEHIKLRLSGQPGGLATLSSQLERLRREADRKRSHP